MAHKATSMQEITDIFWIKKKKVNYPTNTKDEHQFLYLKTDAQHAMPVFPSPCMPLVKCLLVHLAAIKINPIRVKCFFVYLSAVKINPSIHRLCFKQVLEPTVGTALMKKTLPFNKKLGTFNHMDNKLKIKAIKVKSSEYHFAAGRAPDRAQLCLTLSLR